MAVAEPQPSPGSQDLTGVSVGRFAIRALLGSGGMGEVYRADDTRLKRPVALKRVSRKLGADPSARQRIFKEAERASALNSPHIAAVYDVLEENGEVFLVMEYVEGASLRQRLRTSGRFSISEFLSLALQCAEALAAAQKKGIVHRDLKPENILITPGGQAKILDFGLAKHLPAPGEEEVTVSGESLQWSLAGTPGYMAPEVLLGGQADHRSDIFALGVVFYEMLTGRHPFGAEHRTAAALQVTPLSIRQLVPSIPAELDRIIAKMLAKSPDERYATAADLLADLRALERGCPFLVSTAPRPRHWARRVGRGVAVVVLVLLALAITPIARQHWKRWFVGADLPEKKNLAVLPFAVVGEDPGAHAFAQGLAETLTGKLAQLTDNYPLQVVPPSEIRSQKVDSVEQARVGLGANLVLEGSLQRSGSQVRVTYHLVDAHTRQQLRADTVTAQAGDPFAMEDRVVQSVLRSLDLELGSKDRRALQARGTSEPAAYDYYLRGRGYLMEYQKAENVDSAIEVFQRALERDPNYTLAYAGLGESYWHKYQATHAAEWMTRALEACQKAAALGEGAICLGHAYNETGRYDQAVNEFQRALGIDATSDDAYRGLGFAYEHLGKAAEAEQTYKHAIAVRPQYWAGYNWLGAFFFRQGRFQEAASMFQQVTALAPDSFRGYQNLGGAYTALGRFDQALPALEQSVHLRPSASAYSNLGTVHFYLRRFADAARAYEQAVKLDDRNYVLWGNLAEAYYWSPGERENSADAYRKALALAQEQLKVNPRDTSALGQMAMDSVMLGERKPAYEYLRRALVLAPGDPDLQLKAAVIESRLGHPDRAIAFLDKALAAGISPDVIRNAPSFDDLAKTEPWQRLLRGREATPRN
ncbi:MAG TPA: protein kinase [Terriglobales bacterium]|nr:protein kinase [Terriglobales bacterium]